MAEARRITGKVTDIRKVYEQGLKLKSRPKAAAWPALALALGISMGAAVTHLIAKRWEGSPGARIARGASFLEAGAAWTYLLAIRPWHLRWGATGGEVRRPLPGDELVPDPQYETTHAVTIHAPADKIWPWLVQMGQGRGGLYSYDWLENLVGLNIHSADRIIPKFQHLKVGDTIPLAPGGFGPSVVAIEPNQALVLGGAFNPFTGQPVDPNEPGVDAYWSVSWAFVLHELSQRTTRLVVRFRADYKPRVRLGLTVQLPLEPAHFIMERKMLLGIKERAERSARKTA